MSTPSVEEVAGAECTRQYTPVVTLKEEKVDLGETDESELYKQRSLLYRFNAKEQAWKKRAKGDIKLLKHNKTGAVRIVMRQELTGHLRLNHRVASSAELTAQNERSWTWVAKDFADDGCSGSVAVEEDASTFSIKFKNEDIAAAFQAAYDEARKANETATETPAEAATKTTAEEAPVEAKETEAADKEAEKVNVKELEEAVEKLTVAGDKKEEKKTEVNTEAEADPKKE